MSENMWVLVLGVFITLLIGSYVLTICFFIKRERRLISQIQKLVDDAIAGTFQDNVLDESQISALGNSMWRYLCDKELAAKTLLQAKEQLQMQISDIAHQSVIPITNIILYAQLVEEYFNEQNRENSQEIKEEVIAIQQQAETLRFLLEALVKVSKTETGIVNISVKRQPIQPILDVIKNQFKGKAAQKGIEFEVMETGGMAVFDTKWTLEAVANIVDNAIKYTPCGGKIQVYTESYASFLRLDVSDTGRGILEKEQANIFARFYRSEEVSDSPGVGIGLFLAREVMRAQNGYIKLVSEIGRGSTFSLFFVKEKTSQK